MTTTQTALVVQVIQKVSAYFVAGDGKPSGFLGQRLTPPLQEGHGCVSDKPLYFGEHTEPLRL